jgi:MFS family permease
MAIQPADLGLLKNLRFRRLLESRLLGQVAQNALVYSLLILVVEETGSSVDTAILLCAFTLPGIILAVPAGAAADILPKQLTLTAGYLLRAVIAVALAYYHDDLAFIYLLAAASAAVGQVFSPAESSTVPTLVRRDQLTAANSWMLLVLVLGQVIGLVVLAPLLLKVLDAQAVFVACAGLFLSAAGVIGWIAGGFSVSRGPRLAASSLLDLAREGFRILGTNRNAYLATVYLTTAIAVSRALVVLLPHYTEDVLNIKAENTVFVAAPAAIGAVSGLLCAPLLARVIGSWRSTVLGFGLFLLTVIALCVVVYARDFLHDHTHLEPGIDFVENEVGVSSVITVTMLLAIPLGFAFTLLSIAARVVLNEQVPPEAQGRVFAVQMALGDLCSLPPILAAGIAADAVGERPALLTAAISTIVIVAVLTLSRRWRPPPDTQMSEGAT